MKDDMIYKAWSDFINNDIYKEYFLDFYNSLPEKARDKINYGLKILQEQPIVPTSIVRYITNSNGIYELRASVGTNEYRVLFFFEDGDLISGGKIIILGNGFIKKRDKDLKGTLLIAENLKIAYFLELENGDADSDNII